MVDEREYVAPVERVRERCKRNKLPSLEPPVVSCLMFPRICTYLPSPRDPSCVACRGRFRLSVSISSPSQFVVQHTCTLHTPTLIYTHTQGHITEKRASGTGIKTECHGNGQTTVCRMLIGVVSQFNSTFYTIYRSLPLSLSVWGRGHEHFFSSQKSCRISSLFNGLR